MWVRPPAREQCCSERDRVAPGGWAELTNGTASNMYSFERERGEVSNL